MFGGQCKPVSFPCVAWVPLVIQILLLQVLTMNMLRTFYNFITVEVIATIRYWRLHNCTFVYFLDEFWSYLKRPGSALYDMIIIQYSCIGLTSFIYKKNNTL